MKLGNPVSDGQKENPMTDPKTQRKDTFSKSEPLGCVACVHFGTESVGEYGEHSYTVCRKKKNPVANLRSFPFKKQMPCFKLSFWSSEFSAEVDGTDESHDRAVAKYHAKYSQESA